MANPLLFAASSREQSGLIYSVVDLLFPRKAVLRSRSTTSSTALRRKVFEFAVSHEPHKTHATVKANADEDGSLIRGHCSYCPDVYAQ
jgi:hypothetical protein